MPPPSEIPDGPDGEPDLLLAVNVLENLMLGEMRRRAGGDEALARIYRDAMTGLLSQLDLPGLALEAASRLARQIAGDRGLAEGGDIVLSGPEQGGGQVHLRLSYVPQASTWTYRVVEGEARWELPLRIVCYWLAAATEVHLGGDAAPAGRNAAGATLALLGAVSAEEAEVAVLMIVGLEMLARGMGNG